MRQARDVFDGRRTWADGRGRGTAGRGRSTCSGGRRGFTLIELLVVIGIIALLIGILVPALGAARKRSWMIACQANLHGFGEATQAYASDWCGSLPFSNSNNAENTNAASSTQGWTGPGWLYWFNHPNTTNNPNPVSGDNGRCDPADVEMGSLASGGYLSALKAFRCPADGGPYVAGTVRVMTSYIMNAAVSGFPGEVTQDTEAGGPGFALPAFTTDRVPSDGFMYWEPNEADAVPNAAAGTKPSNDTWQCGNNEADCPPNSEHYLTSRHSLGGNLVSCDGHTEFMTTTQFTAEASKKDSNGKQVNNRFNWDPRYIPGAGWPSAQ